VACLYDAGYTRAPAVRRHAAVRAVRRTLSVGSPRAGTRTVLRCRAGAAPRQTSAFPRRAGSGSDSRGGTPNGIPARFGWGGCWGSDRTRRSMCQLALTMASQTARQAQSPPGIRRERSVARSCGGAAPAACGWIGRRLALPGAGPGAVPKPAQRRGAGAPVGQPLLHRDIAHRALARGQYRNEQHSACRPRRPAWHRAWLATSERNNREAKTTTLPPSDPGVLASARGWSMATAPACLAKHLATSGFRYHEARRSINYRVPPPVLILFCVVQWRQSFTNSVAPKRVKWCSLHITCLQVKAWEWHHAIALSLHPSILSPCLRTCFAKVV